MVFFFDFQRLENVLAGSDGHFKLSDCGMYELEFSHYDISSSIYGTLKC
jgi:hypothetical protein